MSRDTLHLDMGAKVTQTSLWISPRMHRSLVAMADARGCSVQDVVELAVRAFDPKQTPLVSDELKPKKIGPQFTQDGSEMLTQHSLTLGVSKAEVIRRAVEQLRARPHI